METQNMSMLPPQAQAGTPSWMLPFTDPNIWQQWFQQAQAGTNAKAAAAASDLSTLVDPAEVVQMQSDYMQQLSSLWQDFMVAKTLTVKDKRFSGPEWE